MPGTRRTRVALGIAAAAAVAVSVLVASAGAATTPPANTSPPMISGTARQGATFTAYPGSWTNSPTSYSYSWIRCDANAANCADIGIHRRQYTLTADDVGHRLKVSVTASNSGGKATAVSTPTPAIAASGSAPSNLVKPTISGDPREGTGLSATNGTWAGTQPITYAFQWNRCDQSGNGCAPIPGAASATYAVATADVGHTVTVTVTAHNPRGNASATSGPTALIAPARAGGAAIAVSTVGLPDRLVVDAVRFSPQPIRTRDAVTARFHVSDLRGFSIQGALVYAIGLPYGWVRNAPEVATDTGGWATITLLPTARMPLGTGALVVFARARKPGDNLLAGVSTRRLVQASIR